MLGTAFFVKELVMAYYKVRIEVWCDWNPAESDLEEIVQNTSTGEAICTKQEVVAVVDRPQDIDDDEAMSFLAGKRGMPTKVRARSWQIHARTAVQSVKKHL